jgi:uncharacterized protein YmfQ (DUF2313 family)
MPQSKFSADDYTQALLALLPRGRAWPKDPGSIQYLTMAALALGLVRLDARAQALLVDAFPGTTLELLEQWEATLGLPDPCDGPDQTIDQRRGQVVNKLVSAGGQSIAYFLGVLARLGYPGAAITQYFPFRADIDAADRPLYADTWMFHWTINLPNLSVFWFEADRSSAGDPLYTVSDNAVTCIIDSLKPAHTTVDFTTNP